MVAYKSPILRLSVGLILVTISLLLVSDLLGLAPNRTRAEIDARKTIAETLAVQISGDMATRRLDSVAETLRALVERNDAVLSAGLRTQGGALLTSAGDHANAWELESDEKSTVTDVQVPIYEKGTRWGSVEVRFAPLEGSLLNRSGGGSFLAVILFVSVAGFLAYFMFLRRALHELDPRAVVPDRVRAALDVLTEGVVIIDKNERIVLANASFARRLEGPADALIGRRLSGLVWGNEQVDPALPTESPPWHAALRGESADMGSQLRLRGASGEEYTFFARASPITGPDAKVRGAVVTFDDMTELERKNADLQHMLSKLERSQNEITRQNRELQLLATRDPLTSALNRRSLFEGVTQLLNDARQSGEHLSCVMVDIDHFKAINDRFGHAAGDKVIKLVAQILAENARSTDLVGRYGGEEFCVIMQGLDSHQASRVAERMRLAIHACKGARFTSVAQITASFGVSGVEHGARTAAELVDQADKALYAAKQSGRDQVIRWSSDAAMAPAPVSVPLPALQAQPAAPRPSDPVQDADQLDSQWDDPTSTPARLLLLDRTRQAIERARRYGTAVAVIALDVEMVRRVGSLLGFAESEKLVTAAMAQLRNTLRSSDSVTYADEAALGLTVSQLGSGEFVVLLTDIGHPESITWVIRRIFSCLGDPIELQGSEVFLTPRIGVSMYPADGEDPDGLLSQAHSALGEAKAALGRDAFVFFSTEMNRRAREQFRLEGLLYRAIERGELYLEYQPRVDLRSGRIKGMEALLRWQQPEVGLISPEIFVALAEHTGLIDSIGEWVLRTACRQAKAWHDSGHPEVSVSVNLSPVQLRQADVVARILAIVAEVGLRPSALILEVTESVLIRQVKNATELLIALRAAGIRVSLDDFGTGHSSLAYVKRFPVDEIKIDRSFVMDLPDNVQDAAICGAIVAMGRTLGIDVVAEGVETDAQLRFLLELQCQEAQGYLFSRPVSREAATDLLDKYTTMRRQVWAARGAREPTAPRAASAEVISILNELPARMAGGR